MNFLNSVILAGLAAALAPLIIHLLNRQKVRTVEFSSLFFLRNLQKTKMRRLKLRQVLLLLIRTLIVVCVVLAFARPTIKGDAFSVVGAHAKTTVVLLTDRSASMQTRTADGSAAERAGRRAREMVGLFKEGDQAIRGEFAATAEFALPTSDFTGLTESLREQVPGAGGTDIVAAIGRAEERLVLSQNLNREIYVFSDLARGGFTASPALPLPQSENTGRIYLIDVDDPRAINAAITAVEFSGELIETGVPFEITATIVNRSAETFEHLLLGVFLDGRRVRQDDVALPPGGTAEASFSLEVETPGLHRGYLELADDDNLADNRFYFTVRIPLSNNVLLVSDFPAERNFIRRALAPGGGGRLAITQRDTRELVLENLAEYDAVVLVAARKPEAVLLENLDRYLRSGGGVLLIPAADIDTAIYNRDLLRRYCGTEFIETPAEFPTAEGYFTLENFAWEHPILSVYQNVTKEKIPEIKFYSVFQLRKNPNLQTIARFSGGGPALVETTIGRGSLLWWCAPLDADYSDLSFHSLFVPLLSRTVEYLAADVGEQAVDYRVGGTVSRARATDWRGPLSLQFPDGHSENLVTDPAGKADRYLTTPLADPGCYTVLAGEQEVDVFAVNIHPDETDRQRIEPEEVYSRLPGRLVKILQRGDDLAASVLASRYGREIWKLLLWAVVGLLAVEMILARTKKSELPPDLHDQTSAAVVPSASDQKIA